MTMYFRVKVCSACAIASGSALILLAGKSGHQEGLLHNIDACREKAKTEKQKLVIMDADKI